VIDDDHGDGQDAEDEQDELPCVVIGVLAELGDAVDAPLRHKHGERPVWFAREQDHELAGVFERLPEGPMVKVETDAILAALRKFSLARSEELQDVLGATDSLRYAFHVDARLQEVTESFEDDGFLVIPLEVISADSDDR
jgi:hypothetical protein